MKRSCSYCGKIHALNYMCQAKAKRLMSTRIRNSEADKFRSTMLWQKKRTEIKERDLYLCQVCIRAVGVDINAYANRKVSVHHIIPLQQDFSRRLDNSNLITLCNYHHKLADSGKIPAQELMEMVNGSNPPLL